MAKPLFSNFEKLSASQWRENIKKDLRGADYFKKVIWRSSEGFNIEPFYTQESIKALKNSNLFQSLFEKSKSHKNDWKIRQDIEVKNIKEANKQALKALMNGANSIGFIFSDYTIQSQSEFNLLLSGIKLDAIELNFICTNSTDLITFLLNEAKKESLDPQKLTGSISYNPLGFTLRNGSCIERSHEVALTKLAQMIDFSAERLPNMHFIDINAHLFQNAGSNLGQELGFALAMASEYIYKLQKLGLENKTIVKHMRISFAIGSNYFMEIAKLRAARWLWTKLLEAYNLNISEISPLYIHTETSHWNMTVYDSTINILRGTTEAMSGILAGVDSLTVTPYDAPYANENEFSDRIGRNIQNILKEEAYFDKVIDPSAGSYYIEELSTRLGEQAWNYFLDIEENGGFSASINSGYLQNSVIEVARNRDIALAHRKIILVGTNQYSNSNEKSIQRKKIENCCPPTKNLETQTIHPLKPYRGAHAFEELRLLTEKMKNRPKVFLFTLGNPTLRKARASFAQNFFGCVGFEIIENNKPNSYDQALKEYKKSNAEIVVACSADEDYENYIFDLKEQITDKALLIVAGNPNNRNILSSKGIKNFIHFKTDILEKLQLFQEEVLRFIN